ncbi:uncharacterized protein ACIB01_016112 isoform 1-T1 [Guaruba guarouba]
MPSLAAAPSDVTSPLPPQAVYYFPPAVAYHLHGESEERDMNAPTSAQSLAAASFQLLGKRGFSKAAQEPWRREHKRCSTGAAPAAGASGTAGGGSGGDNIWTHPRRAHLLMLAIAADVKQDKGKVYPVSEPSFTPNFPPLPSSLC